MLQRFSLNPFAALVAGLFAGRVAGEFVRPGLMTVLFVAVLAGGACWLLSRVVTRRPGDWWPALLLLGYVLYPAVDPRMALIIGGVAGLTFLWLHRPEASGRLAQWLPYLLVSGGFLLLYGRTLAMDVSPADSGELQLVAASWGVAHPPGFALYTLLAGLVAWLPLGASPAVLVNLFSALVSVATLLLVQATIYRLTSSHPAALVAAIALGTATTFWAQATTANVRSLTAFFAALAFFTLVRIRARRQAGEWATAADLALLAIALGWGITHHASLLFMSLFFLLYLLLLEPGLWRRPRRWVRPALLGLLGLLPLLYFPLRAGADVPGAGWELATLSGFLNHVLALGFRGDLFYFVQPAVLAERLRIMVNVLTFQFAPLLLVGAALGWLLLWRRDWKAALLLGGSFAIHTLVTATYRAPQTVEYMLPAYLPVVLCLGYGAGALLTVGAQTGRHWTWRLLPAGAALLLVLAVDQGVRHWPSYVTLHEDRSTRTYTQELLAAAPPNSVILADWHWVTPLWYLQQVEQQRPDVAVRYVFPEGESYEQNWIERIRAELAAGHEVLTTHYAAGFTTANLPQPEPLGDAFWFRQEPRQDLPANFTPITILRGETLEIQGYHLTAGEAEAGREIVLTLAWSPLAGAGEGPWTLFAHLVGVDGAIYAQQDVPVQPQPEGLTLTQLRLTPRPGAAPGDYTLAIGAYRSDDGTVLQDEQGQTRTTLRTVIVQPASQRPFTQQPMYLTAVSGRLLLRLVGYDWDHTLPGRVRLYRHWQTEAGYQTEVLDVAGEPPPLPTYFGPWGMLVENDTLPQREGQAYVPLGSGLVWTGEAALAGRDFRPGQNITLAAHFGASRPVPADLVVSVRLVGYEPDGFHWAWWDLQDSVPALGAIPTLKWIGGSQVRDPHLVQVAETATAGQTVGGILLLYDAFTGRSVPILDETITRDYLGISLGLGSMVE